MPKTIQGVPETVTRERYIELIRSLGFDPELTRRITLWVHSADVEVYDANEQGRIKDGRTHLVTIRVDDAEPDDITGAAV